MVRVIALTQFIFVALGSIAVIVMLHAQTIPGELSHGLRHFLSEHTLWMLAVPIVWSVIANAVISQTGQVRGAVAGVRVSGIALLVAIIATYGWLILSA